MPPESLSLQLLIWGNEESSEDSPYPVVAGLEDCPLSRSILPTPQANGPHYKVRSDRPIAKVKPGASLKQPEEAGVDASSLGGSNSSVLAEFEYQTMDPGCWVYQLTHLPLLLSSPSPQGFSFLLPTSSHLPPAKSSRLP